MYRIPKPWSWFNNKVKTKDDFQFILMVIFIVFIIFTKCYMLVSEQVNQKQPVNATLPQTEDRSHSVGIFITK
jgi:hypothetical protein